MSKTSMLKVELGDQERDTSSGLVGPLLVCKKGVLNADGTQVGHQMLPSSAKDCI